MIVTFNIEPEDLAKLDAMAGPRGRSKWLRAIIAHDYAERALKQRPYQSRRKAATPRKKAA